MTTSLNPTNPLNPPNKDEIYRRIVGVLANSFELEAANIKPESHLQEDLHLDSIDAVDLLVQLKPVIGPVQPEAFRTARTVQDVVDALHAMAQKNALSP